MVPKCYALEARCYVQKKCVKRFQTDFDSQLDN